MTTIRCACGNWLGVLHPDGRVEVRHRGRSLIGRVDEMVCEKCGDVWRADMQKGRDHLPALKVVV